MQESEFEEGRQEVARMVFKMMRHPDWVDLFKTPTGSINRFIEVSAGDEPFRMALTRVFKRGTGSVLAFEGDPGVLVLLELGAEIEGEGAEMDLSLPTKIVAVQILSWPSAQPVHFLGATRLLRVVDNGKALSGF